MADVQFTSCEEPPKTGDKRPPEPTFDELLAHIADTTQPLAQRLSSAQDVSGRLQREIERRCEIIFPDFYWAHSGTYSVGEPGYETLHLPTAKKLTPDFALTPERDNSLRDLGFAYLGNQRLGLVTA